MAYNPRWDFTDPTSRSHVPPGRPKARCNIIGENGIPETPDWRLPARGVFEAPRPKPLAEHELPAEGTN